VTLADGFCWATVDEPEAGLTGVVIAGGAVTAELDMATGGAGMLLLLEDWTGATGVLTMMTEEELELALETAAMGVVDELATGVVGTTGADELATGATGVVGTTGADEVRATGVVAGIVEVWVMTPVVVRVTGVLAVINELVVTVVFEQEPVEQAIVEVTVTGIVTTPPLGQTVVPVVVVVRTVVTGATGVVDEVREMVLFWKGAGVVLALVTGLVRVEVIVLVMTEVEAVVRTDFELVVYVVVLTPVGHGTVVVMVTGTVTVWPDGQMDVEVVVNTVVVNVTGFVTVEVVLFPKGALEVVGATGVVDLVHPPEQLVMVFVLVV